MGEICRISSAGRPFLCKVISWRQQLKSFWRITSKVEFTSNWSDNYETQIFNFHFGLYTEKAKEAALQSMWYRRSNLAAIWRQFDPLVKGGSPWSAMALDGLDAVFLFLGIFLLLSLSVLFGERLSKLLC